MTKRTQDFRPGDRVAYRACWLRSTGTYTGYLPRLRGTVRAITEGPGYTLAVVAWDGYRVASEYHTDGMARVLACNLTLVKRLAEDAAL